MRNIDGSLNGDLGDNESATFSGSLVYYVESKTNENETTYNLISTKINDPPIIVNSIAESSTPQIISYKLVDGSSDNMYSFPDGTVKVNMGVSITLSINANQPNVLNVENGILTIIPPTQGLTYIWRKDNKVIAPSKIISLQSSLAIVENTLTITNMQPIHAGDYTCEVSNDIGSVNSETITIEVYNLDIDSFFYRNLILNPYGKDGTNSWTTNNGDFTTGALYVGEKVELYKPNRVDLFGYTMDMMVPRPYQLNPGVLRGVDLYKELSAPGDMYFTRSNYKYEKRGGNWLVKAYQDIDVTSLQQVIKGGIYGIEGIRAFFSCYIGSALPAYNTNTNNSSATVYPSTRTKESNYDLTRPRLSLQNFINAGPSGEIDEKTTVTIEEYNGETRLASTIIDDLSILTSRPLLESIVLQDPWSKRAARYYGQSFTPNTTRPPSGIDNVLFTAEEIWQEGTQSPARYARPTYGQFIEFNNAVLERLHQDTTKIRITITFEYQSNKWSDPSEVFINSSEEIYEFLSFARRYDTSLVPEISNPPISNYELIRDAAINSGKETQDIILKAGVPRGMVTALNLSLIPILKYDISRTNNHTKSILVKNNTPEGILANGLL